VMRLNDSRGVHYNGSFRDPARVTDGYEGLPSTDATRARLARALQIDALRSQIRCDELPLVCGECRKPSRVCDCPASVQRSVPLRKAR
jgi:hypothetical protein